MKKAARTGQRQPLAAGHRSSPAPRNRERPPADGGGAAADRLAAAGRSRARRRRGLLLATLAVLLSGAAVADGFWPSKTGAAGNSQDLLKADQAFRLVAAAREGDSLKVNWDIAPGYYLYRKRLVFQVVQPQGGRLDAPQLPKGETVHDEHEGTAEIYRNSLLATLHWPKGAAAPQQLRVNWQGCAEAGVCYPPQSRLVDVVDLGR